MNRQTNYRFTDRAEKVIRLASDEANRLKNNYVSTKHILLGIIHEGSGVAAHILKHLNVDFENLRLDIENSNDYGDRSAMTGQGNRMLILGKTCD